MEQLTLELELPVYAQECNECGANRIQALHGYPHIGQCLICGHLADVGGPEVVEYPVDDSASFNENNLCIQYGHPELEEVMDAKDDMPYDCNYFNY